MNTQQESCGLFGKIPQQSDFVNHHLPEAFVEHWHHWIQSCVSISQEQLSDDWLDRYMTSPIWHFAIMPGIAHEKSITGIVIPSVDEVGRYFPLTIAHTGEHDIWGAYLNGDEWYQKAEKVALLPLAENISYSHIVGELENLSVPEIAPLPRYETQSAMHAFKGNQIVEQKALDKHQLTESLVNNAYRQLYGNHSLWWTKGSNLIEPCLAISAGLPDPGQFAAMLDGQWQQWGWSQEQVQTDNQ